MCKGDLAKWNITSLSYQYLFFFKSSVHQLRVLFSLRWLINIVDLTCDPGSRLPYVRLLDVFKYDEIVEHLPGFQ